MTRYASCAPAFAACLWLVLGTGVPAVAQQPAMDPAQMQQFMEQARAMQACMADIDPATMTELQRKGEAMSAAVEALCRAGKRDQAQARAMAFGKDMAAAPELAKMRECGESMRAMLPQLVPAAVDGALDDAHVCDQY